MISPEFDRDMHGRDGVATVGSIDRLGGALRWRGVFEVIGGCGLLALASQVRVLLPGTPVPGTLQLLAVLLIGFLLRPRQAVSAVLLYVVAGSCGLGVFSPGSAGLAGPTAGFLLGFPVTACLVSVLAGRRRASVSTMRLLLAGALGTVCLFASGLLGIMVFLRTGVVTAFVTGVAPFVVKAIVELIIAVSLVRLLRSVRRTATID